MLLPFFRSSLLRLGAPLYFNKIWFLAYFVHQIFYISLFLRTLVRGVVGLKLAYEKPLRVYVFRLPNWDYPLGYARLMGPGSCERQIEGPGS